MLDEELLSKYTDVLPQKKKKKKTTNLCCTLRFHVCGEKYAGEAQNYDASRPPRYLVSGVWREVHHSKAPPRAPIHEPRSRPVLRVSHVRVPYESPVPAVPTRAHPREGKVRAHRGGGADFVSLLPRSDWLTLEEREGLGEKEDVGEGGSR
ncbi:hypothetical protein FHG87_018856 [Trinorchestia longiramus]|nr:hypothetical protein FHG87_018856 [Trinorchestia longiramus]